MSNNEMNGMNGEVGVRLLTLEGCDYCNWLKSELDGQGISYTNIDARMFSDFSDEVEKKFKTESYPIVFIDLGSKVVIIVPETSLEESDTLRIFNSIPELTGMIKSYIK